MKNINITFEDKDYNWMKKRKGSRNWRDFVLESIKNSVMNDDIKK